MQITADRPEAGSAHERPAAPVAVYWLLGAAAAALGALAAWLAPSGAAVVALLAALAMVAAVLALRAYAAGVRALHAAVSRANDGTLEPVTLPGASRTLVGPLAEEYNVLARNFGSLFDEMERAQLSIIGERNRHEAVLQGLPGALLVVDGDFRVTLCNRQAETLFGAPAAALVGANVFDLLHSDEAGRELLREAFLYEQQVANKVLALTLGESLRQISVNLTFFGRSPRDAQASAAIILQDITDWKRLEDLASQAEKLVAMGQLAAGVAHELNTPLGTILGYAKLLTEGRASEEKRAEYAQVIHGETRRCARIVDDLLAYARRDACPAETCEINALAREAVEAVVNCQGRRYCVAIEAPLEGEIRVRGGPGQLDIVLVNLLVNAVQACAEAASPRVRVTTRVEGAVAQVAVEDNGPGVAPQIRAKIFDPFFTTKGESAGTGLGLAISHSIVARAGGTLACDATHSPGARFVVTLPLA